MESQGRRRRGCPRGSSRPPPGFDKQAFVEAMGTAFTTIVQASAVGGQGGPNNLQILTINIYIEGSPQEIHNLPMEFTNELNSVGTYIMFNDDF